MKKIAFLIHDLMGGGAEKVLVNMVNNLDREKYDITVVTLFDEGVYQNSFNDNIHYKSFMKKSFNGNKYVFRSLTPEFWYRKVFGKDKYDVIVSYLEGTCARVVSGCTNAKTVSWIHGGRGVDVYKVCFKNKEEADAAYSSFDEIVCVAQSLKEKFAELCPAFNRAKVLYNVNETDKIIEMSKEEIEDGVFTDVPSIAFLGKVSEGKGIFRLVNIHKRLCDERIPHRFIIMGVGDDEQEAKRILEENGVQDDFVFMGFQKNPYKYLARSDIFVCSSFSEGFSTATTEALVLGVPVVVTDCSGMKEMLCDGEYGIITENDEEPLYEGLKEILTDKQKLEYYTQQAKIRGKDFSMQKTVEKLESFFDSL